MTVNDTPADKAQQRKKSQETLKWGTGLFENDADADIIRDFAKELDSADKGFPNFLYIDSVKALGYRRMLDAGGLDRLLKKRLPIDSTATQYDKNTTRTWSPDRNPGYRLCLLGAVVMRLGCVIRPDFRQSLEDLHAKVGFSRNAQVQLRHALNVYVNGNPYNFRDKPRPTASSGLSDDHIWGDISECMIDLGDNPEPAVTMFSRLFLGPLLKCAAAGDNEHPQDACGNCGRKKALDGSPCRPCTDCGHRLYCSRKCELAHRSVHQLVCKDQFYRVMGNAWAKARNAVDQSEQVMDEEDNSDASTLDKAEHDHQRDPSAHFEDSAPTSVSGSSNDGTNSKRGCGNCGIEAPLNQPPLLCGRCNEQSYCGRYCQKAHWSEHKKYCLPSTSSSDS